MDDTQNSIENENDCKVKDDFKRKKEIEIKEMS